MHPVEILEKISQEAKSKANKTIIAVYREAFNSNDDIELYKLRALLMEQMERSLENTNKSKNTLQTFNEIYKALTYPNLVANIEKVAPLMTNAHITSAEAIFTLYEFKQDFDAIDELSELNDELKEIIETEEITPEQKKIILEICHDVDNAKFEHKITGNNAIKKLHETMLGKLIFYSNEIESINSGVIKTGLGKLYNKIDATNKKINTLLSLASKAEPIVEFLSKLSI